MKQYASHGTGSFRPEQFAALGRNVVFEPGVLVFHPETIRIGDNVYIGHNTILKGYYKGEMQIGEDCWIGQQCFFHSAGDLRIGACVGVAPGVRILSSTHREPGPDRAIMEGAIDFAPVRIGDGSDLGISCVILPGVTIGRGVQVGAGAVVSHDLPDLAVAAGVPAKVLRYRSAKERTQGSE